MPVTQISQHVTLNLTNVSGASLTLNAVLLGKDLSMEEVAARSVRDMMEMYQCFSKRHGGTDPLFDRDGTEPGPNDEVLQADQDHIPCPECGESRNARTGSSQHRTWCSQAERPR